METSSLSRSTVPYGMIVVAMMDSVVVCQSQKNDLTRQWQRNAQATPRDKRQATDTATASPSSLFFPHRLVSVPILPFVGSKPSIPFHQLSQLDCCTFPNSSPLSFTHPILALKADMSIPVVSARAHGQIVLVRLQPVGVAPRILVDPFFLVAL